MSRIDDIAQVLLAMPRIKASRIANELGVDRRDVIAAINSAPELFVRDEDLWALAQQDPDSQVAKPTRRPGPFGPARDLIPKGQQLRFINANEPCHVALGIMANENYSTLPVRNAQGTVIGVFDHAAFAARVEGLRGTNLQLKELCDEPVETMMVDPVFLDPDKYIDTTVDWSNVEHIIVGTPDEPEGILTIADVWARLNDFAEAYVLLHEIEHDLRELIRTVAADKLDDWVCGVKVPPGTTQPKCLEDFNFKQYSLLICEKQTRWPCFKPVLLQNRKIFGLEFDKINDLRNAVMHFRCQASASRCRKLRDFRDRLRRAVGRAHSQ